MPGTQLIQGGWQGGVDRVKNFNLQEQAQKDFGPQSDLFQTINKGFRTPVNTENPFIKGLNFLDQKVVQPLENTSVGTILNPKFIGNRMTNQANYTGDLMKARQEKINAGGQPTFGEEATMGLNTIGTMLPGIDDIVFGGYDYAKAKISGQSNEDAQKSFVGSREVGGGDAPGLGETLFKDDSTASIIGDVAEIPLILGGVLLTGKTNQLDDIAKRVKKLDNISPGSKQAAKEFTNFSDELARVQSELKKVKKPRLVENLKKVEAQLEKAVAAAKDKLNVAPDDLFGNLRKSGDSIKAGSKYNEQLLDPSGFLKKSLPDNIYQPLKKQVFDRLNTLKGEAVDFKNKYIAQVQSLGNNFKKGSKYSELTQKYGEGVKTYDDIVAEVGEQGANEIVNANNSFRRMYDEIIETVNANRSADGLDLISKRDDYYRHIADMTEGDSQLSRMLSGGSGSSAPQSSGIFKSRTGDKTIYDAVSGIIEYLDKSARAGYTDRVAPTINKMSGYLKKQGADATVTQYLDDFSDQILGIAKDSKIPDVINNLGAKMRTSKVVGNASSLAAQPLNIPLGANVAGKRNYLKGLISSDASKASKTSSFLKDRGFRIPNKLESKTGKKIVNFFGGALQDADQIATKSIWKGFYEKAKQLGETDLVQYADDATKQITGGRGIGDFSKWQQTKIGQLLTPFTVEPQAQANKIVSLIGEKKFKVLLGVAVSNFVVNEGFEKTAGYKPLIDPINATMEAYELFTGSEEKEKDKLKAATRIIMEVMQLSPIGNSLFNNAYALAETTGLAGEDGILPSANDLGVRDSTRMNAGNLYNPFKREDITGNKYIDQVLSTTAKFTPGGNQLLKTAGAIKAKADGVVKSKSGKVLFEPSDGLLATGRQLLFGKWADSEAKEMFDNDFDWGLTGKQTEIYDDIDSPEGRTDYLKKIKPSNISDKQLDSILDSGNADAAGGTFENKLTASSSLEDKMATYKELGTIMRNDDLPQEYKDQKIKESGAKPEDVAYYAKASKDIDVKLQEILPEIDKMSNEEMIAYLMAGRKEVADKQLITSDMIEYLYDKSYISKDQKAALKAIKYDQIKDEFYYDRDYDGGGSGKMTYKQAQKLFKIDLPKFSTLKSISSLMSGSSSTSQTSDDGETMLSNILSKRPNKSSNKNSNLWF